MTTTTEDLKLEIKRVLSAPIDRVFTAWTDAQSLRQFITPGNPGHADVECDVRVGGKFRIDMHGTDGKVFKHTGEYLEVLPPRRLKFTWISAATNQLPTVVTIDLRSLGEFASNLAIATMMMPLAASLAVAVGQPPVVLMLVAGFASSLGFALPVATPPNAIVFGSGEIPMRQMVKAGLLVDVVGVIVVAVLLSWLAPLVL